MAREISRRTFAKTAAVAIPAAALSTPSALLSQMLASGSADRLFEISLAEWSLHRTINAGELDNLDFPVVTRTEYGLEAVEFVNSFFQDRERDETYLRELVRRADDHGVRRLLIMCDGEGAVGDPKPVARRTAVENHYRWVDAAKYLGCHSIRVNAQSEGTPAEQRLLVADGLRRIIEYADPLEINVIVENHGGLSSNGEWLASVIRAVDHPRCGTLPDFGNFRIGEGEWYDRYRGVEELMPFAKAVSAKSRAFDEDGLERHTDFAKMLQIVLRAGYHGYVGIEYEGDELSEPEGIRATKALLERTRDLLAEA